PDHPDIAASLNNVAAMVASRRPRAGPRRDLEREREESKRNRAEAEQLFREALAMDKKLHGAEHLDVARSLASLATLLESGRDHDAAEPLYREALDIRRKLLGKH